MYKNNRARLRGMMMFERMCIAVLITMMWMSATIGQAQTSSVELCHGTIPSVFLNDTSIAGGVGPFTYLWQRSSDSQTWQPAAGNNDSSSFIPTLALTDTTFYRRIVVDQSCGDTAFSNVIELQVSEPLAITETITNVTCNGLSDGNLNVSTGGGIPPYTYAWSTSANDTTATLMNLMAGTYTLTVTDSLGCTLIDSFTITEPQTLMAVATVDSVVSCNGFNNGGISATATGGTMPYHFQWTNNDTTASITGLMPQAYSVTITDALGCSDTASATITEPDALVATLAATDATCEQGNDGQIQASASGGNGGYSYLWNTSETSTTIDNLSDGTTYRVTVTDSKNCVEIDSATINFIHTLPPVDLGADTVHGVATALTFTSGAEGEHLWSNGATTDSIMFFLASDTTIWVQVEDSNGCINSDTLFIEGLLGTEILITNAQVKLFPNPTRGELNIELTKSSVKEAMITITDFTGKVVYREPWQNLEQSSKKAIDLSQNSPGVYLVNILLDGTLFGERIVLE